MTDGPQGPAPDLGAGSDAFAQPALELLVEAVAEICRFETVTLALVRDGALVPLAHTGNADPVDALPAELTALEPTTDRLLLPAEGETGGPVLGLLVGAEGRLVGVLRFDHPLSGRRPGVKQRRLLERCVAQTERAVVAAIDREELRQQVGYAETARRMVRAALMPAHASLDDVLEHTHRPLVEGFHALGSWIEVADAGTAGRGFARARDSAVVPMPDDVVDVCHLLGRRLWAEQRTLVITTDPSEADEAPELPAIRRQLTELGLTSALAVPLGAGQQYFGYLALARGPQGPPWSPVEQTCALQIGHDLGVALRTASALERERRLVRELQQLDDYRSSLIATLSHELRTPLTVISGNLEMLGALEMGEEAGRHHQAMTRGAGRMQRLVDDLLLLARVSDPQHPLEHVVVDLREVVQEVVALVSTTMQAKEQSLTVQLPPDPLALVGSPAELDRLVGNLVSNAAKYTPSGGAVTVAAERDGADVRLVVADTGIGIAPDDVERLFRAFYRTSNPDALRQPGTGLGLSIVATIAERHGGTVEVASELGRGTTFTVRLPAAG